MIMSWLFTFLASPLASAGNFELRGYVQVNQVLRERLFSNQSTFELSQYVGQAYDPFGTNLLDLLGTYKSGFAGGRYRNGQANALNMVIWQVLFLGLADELVKVCTNESALPLSPEAQGRLRSACGGDLQELWFLLMASDAPWEEFEAWQNHWWQQRELEGSEALRWQIVTILLNPHFMLR